MTSVSEACVPAQPDVFAVTIRRVLREELQEELFFCAVWPAELTLPLRLDRRRGSALA